MKNILFIDDDKHITKVFKESFCDEFSITTFNNAADALKHLKNNLISYDFIISDFIMDDMDGGRFLHEAKQLLPTAKRLIITGYKGSTEIKRNLDNDTAQGLIYKPWDYEYILDILTKPEILSASKLNY